MEEKLIKIEVNLQQSIIWTGSEGVSNSICAITHRHRKVVVIRPEYRQIQNEILALVDFKKPHVVYGDSFSVDTWDGRIDDILRTAVLREEVGNTLDEATDADVTLLGEYREEVIYSIVDFIKRRERE